MAHVRIYTKTRCPFSIRAKQLLREKGVSFEEIDITKEPSRREEMIEAANGRSTYPQVFIDGHLVGGCDDLYIADGSGKLDQLLSEGDAAPA